MTEHKVVNINYADNTLTISGYYTAGREGVQYKRNGDPGDPPEPEEFEIETIWIGSEDVTELMATLYYEYRGVITRDISYKPLWEKLEELCIEAVREEKR